MNDSHIISILKSLSWRMVGTITTGILVFLLTGNIKISYAIGGLDFFSKVILYYVHERFWEIKKVRSFSLRVFKIKHALKKKEYEKR